jgi:hypothetical protein
MENNKSSDKIRNIPRPFDTILETQEVIAITSFFFKNCINELLGIQLMRKRGIGMEVKWLYYYIQDIKCSH